MCYTKIGLSKYNNDIYNDGSTLYVTITNIKKRYINSGQGLNYIFVKVSEGQFGKRFNTTYKFAFLNQPGEKWLMICYIYYVAMTELI